MTALNFSGQLTLHQEAQHLAAKADEEFDPRIREASADLLFEGSRFSTKNSKMTLYFDFPSHDQTHKVAEGDSISFEQLYRLSREDAFSTSSYAELRAKQISIFEDFWSVSDIEIEGDDILQKGIRLNLYHLFTSAGRDGLTNFGAKGLTGEGYEGHYFWDTEMYLLPFFTFTQPEIAKSLLTYRLNKLPLAKERAKELSFEGALFP